MRITDVINTEVGILRIGGESVGITDIIHIGVRILRTGGKSVGIPGKIHNEWEFLAQFTLLTLRIGGESVGIPDMAHIGMGILKTGGKSVGILDKIHNQWEFLTQFTLHCSLWEVLSCCSTTQEVSSKFRLSRTRQKSSMPHLCIEKLGVEIKAPPKSQTPPPDKPG